MIFREKITEMIVFEISTKAASAPRVAAWNCSDSFAIDKVSKM
jgi:hypothetical protein